MAETDIERLKAEHARLEALLEEEAGRPLPDQVTVKQIKQQKLRIKDRIARLQRAAAAP